MRLHVSMKFNDAQREEIVKFANHVGMGVDEFCKRAVFYAINDAYRRAEEAVANGTHNSVSGDAEGNSREAFVSGSTDSAALSDQNNASTDSQA